MKLDWLAASYLDCSTAAPAVRLTFNVSNSTTRSNRTTYFNTADMQSQQRNRRGRIPLSCDPCRTRKLKCNREWPCQNCRARDEHAVAVAACKFRGVAPKNDMLTAVPLAERHASGDGTGSLRRRINDLEDMVKRLIEHQAPHTPSSGPSVGVNTPEGARVAVEAGIEGRTILGPDGHSIYHGGDALHTLLEEVPTLSFSWPCCPSLVGWPLTIAFGNLDQRAKGPCD